MTNFLNEAYQGKPKKLIEIEKKLDIICQYFKFNGSKASVNDVNIIISQIEKDIGQLFGFTNVFLNIGGRPNLQTIFQKEYSSSKTDFRYTKIYRILENTQAVNAYTMIPLAMLSNSLFNPNNSIVLENNIYRYKEPISVMYIVVYQELFRQFSGGEVLSVILHEIGHNFYQFRTTIGNCFNTYISVFQLLYLIDYLVKDYLLGELIYRIPVLNFITKSLDAIAAAVHKILKLIFDNELGSTIAEVNTLINLLQSFSDFLMSLTNISSLKNKGLRLVLGNVTERHSQEKFADEFVSMLGYSVELSKSFTSMDGYDSEQKEKNKNLVYGFAHTINNTIYAIYSLFGPHPAMESRIENSIKYLEKQKSQAKSVKLKQMIQLDIDNTNEVLALYKHNSNSHNLFNNADIRKHMDPIKQSLEDIFTLGFDKPMLNTDVLDFLTKNRFMDLDKNLDIFSRNTNDILDKAKEIGKNNMLSGFQ